jgi:hypothetical protein
MKKLTYLLIALMLGLAGCMFSGPEASPSDGDDDVDLPFDDDDDDDIDITRLDEFLNILPKTAVLKAAVPEEESNDTAAALFDAYFPSQTVPMAREINGAIVNIIDLVEQIVAIEPTFWDSEKQEYVWGPWDKDDSALEGDTNAFWIKDNGADTTEDFRYIYALVRGMGNDLATMTPILWGGANPDPDNEDFGNGVILWDLEANAEFELAHDPDYVEVEQGRFAAIYSRGEAEDNPENVMTWVVATFHDFIASDMDPSEGAMNLDYLYGRHESSEMNIDFLNFEMIANIDDEDDEPDKTDLETLNIKLGFIDRGRGAAEALVTGGDIAEGEYIEAFECWNASIVRLYYLLEYIQSGGNRVELETEGDPSVCQDVDLSFIPDFDDLDSGMLDALYYVTANGIPE